MNTCKDDKLEKFISRIKESKNSNNKLLNYKKATDRLDELKTEYNKLCEALKKNKKQDKSENKISIEKISVELNKINEELDNENCDILKSIDSYVQYKLLLDSLEFESEKIKNEIFKVNLNKNKINIVKLEPNDIL
jgi:phenylalanyl-tRNA synthetase alpha subunit